MQNTFEAAPTAQTILSVRGEVGPAVGLVAMTPKQAVTIDDKALPDTPTLLTR
jgi:hypothetical protein